MIQTYVQEESEGLLKVFHIFFELSFNTESSK